MIIAHWMTEDYEAKSALLAVSKYLVLSRLVVITDMRAFVDLQMSGFLTKGHGFGRLLVYG